MKKYVTFELNDEIYQLRFGVNEMCDMEDILDKPVSELGTRAGMRELRVMFYCGLRGSVTDMDLVTAGKIMGDVITEKGMDYLQGIVAEAMELALGQSAPSKATKVKKK